MPTYQFRGFDSAGSRTGSRSLVCDSDDVALRLGRDDEFGQSVVRGLGRHEACKESFTRHDPVCTLSMIKHRPAPERVGLPPQSGMAWQRSGCQGEGPPTDVAGERTPR